MSTYDPNQPQEGQPYDPNQPYAGGQPPAGVPAQPPAYGTPAQPAYGTPAQPAYNTPAATGTPPPNYLVWAIISILLCTPFGIAAIVFSTQVNSKWQMGDVAGAQDSSKKAKTFSLVSTIIGGIAIVFYILYFAFIASMLANSSTY